MSKPDPIPPKYLRVIAPAEGGGWLVRNQVGGKPIRRAEREGWRATACGPYHCHLQRAGRQAVSTTSDEPTNGG